MAQNGDAAGDSDLDGAPASVKPPLATHTPSQHAGPGAPRALLRPSSASSLPSASAAGAGGAGAGAVRPAPSPSQRRAAPPAAVAEESGLSISEELLSSVEAAVERRVQSMLTELKAHQDKREKVNKQRQERLLEAVAKTLNERLPVQLSKLVVRGVAEQVVPQLTQSLSAAVREAVAAGVDGVAPTVSRAVTASLAAQLPAQVREQVGGALNGVGAQVAKQVAVPVADAFQRGFATAVIPAFERGTQDMLQQISDVFTRGSSARAEAEVQAGQDLRAAVVESREQLASMHAAATSLAEQLRETQALVAAQAAELRKAHAALAQAQVAQAQAQVANTQAARGA